MPLLDVFPFIRCPEGKGHTLKKGASSFLCAECGKEYPLRGNRMIFSDYPSNLYVRSVGVKERWTSWRRMNYEYFKMHLAGVPRDGVLVDLGAGPSDFRELTGEFHSYLGVDIYPYELVSVVANLSKPLPLASDIADVVFASNVLEHLPEPNLFLNECARVLKPGGLIIGTVPFFLEVHHAPHDFYRYTYCMLERMLREANLSRAEVTSLGTPYDTYKTLQYFFIGMLLKETRNNFFLHLGARALRKIIHLTHLLGRPILAKVAPSLGYTLGYGFKAYKNL